jgi:hypothetical protein
VVSVEFYKKGNQGKYLSRGRIFSDFPARLNEQGWFWFSAPWTRFGAQPGAAVWIFSPGGFRRVFATKLSSSETDKQRGCQCQPWFYLRLAAYSFFGLSERA